jgi:hypothetical protein
MLRRWLGLVFVTLAVVLVPHRARADQGTAHSLSVAVLAFDSDDAEEQADALSGALRSRVRASQGWSLIETSQSLGMITAALRCPGKPVPADCEQRIADQIKSDRYIFGYVQRGPQAGQVTAEVHLYQKSKPDTIIRESYADNLRDQNDETLRKIAQRVLDRLGGTAVGVIVVRMGSESGEVVVDGDKHVPLQNGSARLELAPGGHSVEVVVNGQSSQKRNVLVTAGKETVVDLTLGGSAPELPKSDKPFPTKKVIGIAGMVVGAGLGVFAVERLLKYNSLQDEIDNNPAYGPDKFQATDGKVDACDAKLKSDGLVSENACNKSKEAKTVSTTGIIMAGAGGLFLVGGAVLFFMSDWPSSSTSTTAKRSPKPRITPTFGYGAGGVMFSGSF